MRQKVSTYKEALQYLYGLQKYGIKFGLSKTANLLYGLGNPHEGRKYIHIGGTNGKGSIAAFLASVLKEAGLKVGTYTSPHLLRFTERFKVNDVEISKSQVISLVNELRSHVVESEPPTFFEATTAMALAYFADQGTDMAIMEVGMGGRLDATNVILPMVSVISNIGMEHQFFLGNTLLKIAHEKAGIIKAGVPVVTGVSQNKVVDLIREVCIRKGAPLRRLGEHVRYRRNGTRLFFWGDKLQLKNLELGLNGNFQGRNAALALTVIEVLMTLGINVSEENIRCGLKHTKWPGRMDVIETHPTILVDGAHNPAAMKALATSLDIFPYDRLLVVLGVMEDKDIGGIVSQIAPKADHIIYTRPKYPRAADPELLWKYGRDCHRSGEVVSFIGQAIDKARSLAKETDLIVICGSLFTVGEAMNHVDPTKYEMDEI